MEKRIEVENPKGLSTNKMGMLELRCDVDGASSVIAIPAKAAAYLIGALQSQAEDHARITLGSMDDAALPVETWQLRGLATRDAALLVLRVRSQTKLTFRVSLDHMVRLGTALLNGAKTMKESPAPKPN